MAVLAYDTLELPQAVTVYVPLYSEPVAVSTIPATVIDDPTVNGVIAVVAKVNVATELATVAPVTVRSAPFAVLSA